MAIKTQAAKTAYGRVMSETAQFYCIAIPLSLIVGAALAIVTLFF